MDIFLKKLLKIKFLSALSSTICSQRSLIDTFFSLVLINLCLAALSFLTTLLIANNLGKEQFGVYSFAFAVGGYCVTIANCGLERTLVRDLIKFPKDFNEYISAKIFLSSSFLGISILVIWIINTFTSTIDKMGLGSFIIVFSLGVKAVDLKSVYDVWSEMKRHSIYYLIERCVYISGIWIVIFSFPGELSIKIIAFFLISSVIISLFLQYKWALPQLNIIFDYKNFTIALRLLQRNIWIWISILSALSFGVLSRILLKIFCGNSELGSYSVAWQIVTLGSLLVAQISRIGNPRLVKVVTNGSIKKQQYFLAIYFTIMVGIISLISFPSIFFPKVILSVFRPEYITSAKPMAILGIYLFVVGIGLIAAQYLIAVGKEKFYSQTSIIFGFFSILLYTLLIPRWQALGAALSVLFSHGGLVFVHTVSAISHLKNNNTTIPNGI